MPEKSLNEIPASVREMYDKGMAALQKNNLDYAVTLFMQVLRLEPGLFDARQALRATQHKRAGNRSGGFFKKFLGSANTLTKGQMALRNNPLEALQIAEESLNDDPTNSSAHQLLAEAALASDFPKTALLSLEVAFKFAPSDRKLAVKLADTANAVGQRARAEKLLRDLLATDPHDPHLNEKLKNLLATRTLKEGGYQNVADGTGSYRDILKDKEQSVRLEQEQRTVKDGDVAGRLIQDAESRLAQEGNNLRTLRELAELHETRREYDRARHYYQRLIEVSGVQDPLILKALRETHLAEFAHKLQALDLTDPAQAAEAETLKAGQAAFLLEDARRRAEANPTDLQVRYELGELYFQAGRVTEAIGELQKAQNNPHRRIGAMALLARCFAQRGMNDLAARKLQEALKEKVGFDDERKELHYQLGTILEKAGRGSEAIEQFKTIYELDITFRDVADKVDAYYASQG
jgi:tetratricopeptide (TPR) repeat protein